MYLKLSYFLFYSIFLSPRTVASSESYSSCFSVEPYSYACPHSSCTVEDVCSKHVQTTRFHDFDVWFCDLSRAGLSFVFLHFPRVGSDNSAVSL